MAEDIDALTEDLAKVRLDEESAATSTGSTLVGSCKCGGCRFRFPLSKVEPHGSGKLDMSNCHCKWCRRAHSAAFASYVTVPTAAVDRLKGEDLLVARTDRCDHFDKEALHASYLALTFCSKCFSSLATFPKVGVLVCIDAGCLEADGLKVESFIPWCREQAPAYLGFIPATKKQKQKAKQSSLAKEGPVTGGCSCGACRFKLPRLHVGELQRMKFPEELQHCYCGSCRKLSGAAWQSWMPIEEGQLKWTMKESLKLVRTTSHAKRHVCATCGVFMTIVYDEDGAVWPLAGCVDDSSYTKEDLCLQVSDVSHICVKYKQPWWVLPNDGLPRIKGAS